MKHSLADHLAAFSAAFSAAVISFLTAALTMGVLTAGTVGAVRVAAGHTPVQNPHWRKFCTIAILSAAGTATLQINGLSLP